MSQNEYLHSEELFSRINGCFELVTDLEDFISVMDVTPDETIVDFVLDYYFYINSKPETCLPFRNYIQFISMLPLIPSKEGNIYKCNSCQFYTIFPSLKQSKYITKPLYGFYIPSNYRNTIPDYIENYNKATIIGENTEENQYNHFIAFHQKYARNNCHELSITRYNAFGNEYHDFFVKESSITPPVPQIKDKLVQLQNYLTLITTRYSFKNQPITSNDITTAIQYTKLYLHSYICKPYALYYTICACFLILILNHLYNKYVLSDLIDNKTTKFRYPNFPIHIITNIFGTTIASLQHNIPLFIKNILTKPNKFFTGNELYGK